MDTPLMSLPNDILSRALKNAIQGEIKGHRIEVPDLTERQLLMAPDMMAMLSRARTCTKVFSFDQYFVQYEADSLPENSEPSWTLVDDGSVPVSFSGSKLSINAVAPDSVFWYLVESSFDAVVPVEIEARLKIVSSTADTNKGFQLSVFNGTSQFTSWIRAASCNIDNAASVIFDFTDAYHTVRLVTAGDACRLYVDGYLRQFGSWINSHTKKAIAFGTWVDPEIEGFVADGGTTVRTAGSVECLVDYVRVKVS
jgi:hypothetical protein